MTLWVYSDMGMKDIRSYTPLYKPHSLYCCHLHHLASTCLLVSVVSSLLLVLSHHKLIIYVACLKDVHGCVGVGVSTWLIIDTVSRHQLTRLSHPSHPSDPFHPFHPSHPCTMLCVYKPIVDKDSTCWHLTETCVWKRLLSNCKLLVGGIHLRFQWLDSEYPCHLV